MILSRRGALGALATASLTTLAACGSDAGPPSASASGTCSGSVKGAGATSQGDAQTAWMNAFMDANPAADVEYAGGGSGAGRTRLIEGAVDFAGSDSPMGEEELARAGDVVELPLYVSPIAITYRLPGLTGRTHVQMSGTTVAKVFRGEVTRWNDAALVADNPGLALPDLGITVVHRSDDSGTTTNLTEYLSAVAPEVWTDEPAETWPLAGGQSGDGTPGVITTVSSAEGTIGYADASKVTDDLGTVAVGADGRFVACSAETAAATLAASEPSAAATDTRIIYDIKRDVAGTYPVILVSYLIARQSYGDAELAGTVKGYLASIASEEGQQAAADAAGSVPVPDPLRERVTAAIDTIRA